MEFLQHWRYGDPHSTSTSTPTPTSPSTRWRWASRRSATTGSPAQPARWADRATARAIEPRWSPPDDPGARDGDRLYVVDAAAHSRRSTCAERDPVAAHRGGCHGRGRRRRRRTSCTWRARTGHVAAWTRRCSTRCGRRCAAEPRPRGADRPLLGTPVRATALAVADGASCSPWATTARWCRWTSTTGELIGVDDRVDGARRSSDPAATIRRRGAARRDRRHRARRPRLLADDLVDDAGTHRGRCSRPTRAEVVAGGLAWTSATERAVQGHIDDGTLTGVELDGAAPWSLAATADAVLLDAGHARRAGHARPGRPGAWCWRWRRAASSEHACTSSAPTDGASCARQVGRAALERSRCRCPAPRQRRASGTQPANLVHVGGQRARTAPPTVYVDRAPRQLRVRRRAAAVRARGALVMDTQPDRPGDDRTQLLALAADGRMASVEVGSNAFGWRLPGVLMGAATAAVSVPAGAAPLPAPQRGRVRGRPRPRRGDAVRQLRIAMNDVYVTVFLVCRGHAVRARLAGQLARAVAGATRGLLAVGVLLGLALASKWVAAYAIGGFVLLVLLRSALGPADRARGHAAHHGRAGRARHPARRGGATRIATGCSCCIMLPSPWRSRRRSSGGPSAPHARRARLRGRLLADPGRRLLVGRVGRVRAAAAGATARDRRPAGCWSLGGALVVGAASRSACWRGSPDGSASVRSATRSRSVPRCPGPGSAGRRAGCAPGACWACPVAVRARLPDARSRSPSTSLTTRRGSTSATSCGTGSRPTTPARRCGS